jgi:hypothetical protein
MDHLTFAQLLGNYGEFIGALAVVATLVYLAIQVRHTREATEANTQSLEANRQLALAQAYQARANATRELLAFGSYSGAAAMIDGLMSSESFASAFEKLSPSERTTVVTFESARWIHFDNLYYQYQNGFIGDDFFQNTFTPLVNRFGRNWEELGQTNNMRTEFKEAVERIVMAAD